MTTLTFIIAVIAYIMFNFTFAMVWNMVLFKKLYARLTAGISRENPIIPLGLLAIVIQGLALATLFSLFSSGTNLIVEGPMLGLLIGSYSIVYGAFVVPAKFKIKPVSQYAILELVYGFLHFSIAGIIVAYIMV
ncbi:hypothetical protein KW805_03785 [Candidatus Pacearchaeota archaeon]|nr:hypothetical protein [Candidatus Pacearchaeota archaeon]